MGSGSNLDATYYRANIYNHNNSCGYIAKKKKTWNR